MTSKVHTEADLIRNLLIQIEETADRDNAQRAAAIRDLLGSRREAWRKGGRIVGVDIRPDLWTYVRVIEDIIGDMGMTWAHVMKGGQTAKPIRLVRQLIVRLLKRHGLSNESIRMLFGVKSSAELKRYMENKDEIIAIGKIRAYDSESFEIVGDTGIGGHLAAKGEGVASLQAKDSGWSGDSDTESYSEPGRRGGRRSGTEELDR